MLITSFILSLLSPTVDLVIGQTNYSLSTHYFAQMLLLFYWVDLKKAENVRQSINSLISATSNWLLMPLAKTFPLTEETYQQSHGI